MAGKLGSADPAACLLLGTKEAELPPGLKLDEVAEKPVAARLKAGAYAGLNIGAPKFAVGWANVCCGT
jgi:hypothetical protein